jgi:hypothetical protein
MIPEIGERADFKETLLSLEMSECSTCLRIFVVQLGGENIACPACLESGIVKVVSVNGHNVYLVDISVAPPDMAHEALSRMRHRLRDAQAPKRQR